MKKQRRMRGPPGVITEVRENMSSVWGERVYKSGHLSVCTVFMGAQAQESLGLAAPWEARAMISCPVEEGCQDPSRGKTEVGVLDQLIEEAKTLTKLLEQARDRAIRVSLKCRKRQPVLKGQ